MKKSKINKGKWGYLFIAPYFITFFIFGVFPILYTFYLSFTKYKGTGTPKFVGLQNYTRLFEDKFFYTSIGNTLYMWLLCIIPQMLCALILAVVLTQSKLKGKGFFRAIFYLPNLVTMSSVAVLFTFIMDWQCGALNKILVGLHLISSNVNWLQSTTATPMIVAFINWWMWFGYSMIIFMAGIQAISQDVIEAAVVDGANSRQMLTNITLPLIRPTVLYNIITSLIGGMIMFDVPFVLTNGDGSPQGSILTMVMYLYNTAFRNYNYGYGATIGTGLFVIITIMVVIVYKFINRKQESE